MTGYSDTAGQGLGTGFTLSGDKDDRGNVTGTTFTNAEDLITTGPKATGIMKVVEDVMGAPKSILDDLTMGYKAGLFSNRADQEANLLGGWLYWEQIYDYFARTDATKQRMKDQAAANYANRGDDKDMTAAVIDDPCPEGYKLDPITNECVMDDTIDVLNPGGQQVTDFVMPSVNPVIGQAANYTGAVAPTNMPMPLQPYAPGTSGNLLQSSAPGLARTRAGGIMGL